MDATCSFLNKLEKIRRRCCPGTIMVFVALLTGGCTGQLHQSGLPRNVLLPPAHSGPASYDGIPAGPKTALTGQEPSSIQQTGFQPPGAGTAPNSQPPAGAAVLGMPQPADTAL